MADFGAPATPNYTAPDGLKTLGDIMSLKRSAQGLQAQQLQMAGQTSTNQSLAANASIDTRTAAEQAKLAQVDWSAFQKPDGSYDVDGAQKQALQIAPTTGADFAKRLNETTRGAAETKKAFLTLSQDMQQGVRSTLGSWGADPNSNIGDLRTQAEVAKDNAPDAVKPHLSTVVDHALRLLTGPDPLTGNPRTKEQQKALAVGFSRAGLSNTEVSGPGGLATPQGATMDNNAQIQPGTTASPLAGGGFTPSGPPITKTLSPTDKPDYVAQRTSASSRATGTASSDIDRSNEVASVQQQSAAAIPLTQRIDQLSHEINSGHLAKMLSEGGNYLGFSSINDARSQLLKDLGQVKGLATAKAGSDSRAATILEGYPTDTTPEATVHAAMDYIRGTARQNLARGSLLSQYQKEDKGLKGFQAADNVLSGKTNPLMHEYLALKPDEQAGFYRRNFSNPQEAQAFKDEVNALKKHTHAFGQ